MTVVAVPSPIGRLVGATEAGQIRADRAAAALNERPEHLAVQVSPGRLAVEADHGIARALVDVMETQAVDLRVMGFEVVARQALEALVRSAKHVHGGGSICPTHAATLPR